MSAPPDASSAASASDVDAFRRRALQELVKPGAEDAPEARAYLAGLAPDRRRTVAQAVATDADRRLSAIGIDRLVSDGFEDDAVPALARRVAEGDDLTGFGYQWAHGEDESLALRMYVKIGRHLLAHLDGYAPAERAPVERFLMDGGFAQPLTAFSKAAVEERLARIAERAKK
jgi:hypothetical protein